MPFYCTVCGNLFKTSQEIIQHLIEHSDANTVSNRQPVVSFARKIVAILIVWKKKKKKFQIKLTKLFTKFKVGPRKYKRRRKLKPEELESFRKSKNDTTTTGKNTPKRSSRKRDASEHSDAYYR